VFTDIALLLAGPTTAGTSTRETLALLSNTRRQTPTATKHHAPAVTNPRNQPTNQPTHTGFFRLVAVLVAVELSAARALKHHS